VVLSDDIFTIDPGHIENVKVDLTIVEGQAVYRRPGSQ
jgi:predicted amidohydrolase YtcJ